MNEIFNDAKFGKHYLTKNKELAIYLWKGETGHILAVNNDHMFYSFSDQGIANGYPKIKIVMKIEDLHELDQDVMNLEDKYNAAINYICALRKEKATFIKGIMTGQIGKLQETFISDDWEGQIGYLENKDNISESLKRYNYDSRNS